MNIETKEIFVLSKAIQENETVVLKLEQSAHNRGKPMLWLASSY